MGNILGFECTDKNYLVKKKKKKNYLVEKESQVMEGTVFLHKTLGPFLNLWRWQSGQGSFPGRKYQTLHER